MGPNPPGMHFEHALRAPQTARQSGVRQDSSQWEKVAHSGSQTLDPGCGRPPRDLLWPLLTVVIDMVQTRSASASQGFGNLSFDCFLWLNGNFLMGQSQFKVKEMIFSAFLACPWLTMTPRCQVSWPRRTLSRAECRSLHLLPEAPWGSERARVKNTSWRQSSKLAREWKSPVS